MMESFRIYQVTNSGSEYSLRPVDSVPAGVVCTVYVGGNGIVNETRAMRLGAIVDREILEHVIDIPNYVVVYDELSVSENRPERLIEMDRRGNDVLPRTDVSAAIYLNSKNLDIAYRRRILPLFIHDGPRGIQRIQFAIDGDMDDIVSQLVDKVRRTMRVLDFPQNVVFATLNMVLRNCYSYSDYTPPYPDEMFEKILLPRISDGNGNRIDTDTAMCRVRKLNLLAQCHGGHVVRMMERAMNDAMVKMGYSATEINKIMSQVLVTAYAPSCALGDSRFQFVGFMSAYDYTVDTPNNWVYRYISDNRTAESERFSNGHPDWEWKLPPMFLHGRNGNIFLVKRRFKFSDDVDGPNLIPNAEHNNAHYTPHDVLENNKLVTQTDDGKLISMLAHNVVTNGIRNSLAQHEGHAPLPPISELVLDGKNDDRLKSLFAQMTAAGDRFIDDVYAYAREHNAEIHPPRDQLQYKKFQELKR